MGETETTTKDDLRADYNLIWGIILTLANGAQIGPSIALSRLYQAALRSIDTGESGETAEVEAR